MLLDKYNNSTYIRMQICSKKNKQHYLNPTNSQIIEPFKLVKKG